MDWIVDQFRRNLSLGQFNHPKTWFGPGVKGVAPRSWEGWLIMLGLMAVGLIAALLHLGN